MGVVSAAISMGYYTACPFWGINQRFLIAIEAFQREWQQLLDGLNLVQEALGALVPGGPAFGPAGNDIRHGQTPDEITGQRIATMGDGIGFDKAGLSSRLRKTCISKAITWMR